MLGELRETGEGGVDGWIAAISLEVSFGFCEYLHLAARESVNYNLRG